MAKRISLREFQESLTDRLLLAEQGQVSRALLGVESGRGFWLLDLADSGEVVPLPTLTSVPLTKSWFAGVANIRGTLYSVVDFAAFMGLEPTPRNSDARLLLAGARHGINSALLVTRTLGLRPLNTLQPDASVKHDDRPWIGESYLDPQGRRWSRLQVRPLLADKQFIEIGL
jgi:twitching motility protein PilI